MTTKSELKKTVSTMIDVAVDLDRQERTRAACLLLEAAIEAALAKGAPALSGSEQFTKLMKLAQAALESME